MDKKENKKVELEEEDEQVHSECIKAEKKDIPTAKIVNYCAVCTYPVEYCEYSHELIKKIAREEKKNVETKKEEKETSKDDKPDEEKTDKTEKVDNKEEKGEEGEDEKKLKKKKEKKDKDSQSAILVTNHKRSKKKVTTTVSNVEKFGLNMKDVSKLFSKKFACSSSITKENNSEFITLTGDFGEDIIEFLIEKFPQLKQENFKFVETVHKD